MVRLLLDCGCRLLIEAMLKLFECYWVQPLMLIEVTMAPLRASSVQGHVEVGRLLLDAAADANLGSNDGATAPIACSELGTLKLCNYRLLRLPTRTWQPTMATMPCMQLLNKATSKSLVGCWTQVPTRTWQPTMVTLP